MRSRQSALPGYGRFLVGKEIHADLIQEELTVNSKGAVYLANRQHGPATVIDIGGMDNKAISVMDGIPGVFTMGVSAPEQAAGSLR